MRKTTRILIAEHEGNDVEMIQFELRNFETEILYEIVQDELGFIHALTHFIPDIILSDYVFPSFHGTVAFRLKELLAPGTPFIFVSGTIGEEKSIELIRTGVTDYALKENLSSLPFKIFRALKESDERKEKDLRRENLILSEARLNRAQHLAKTGNWEWVFSNDLIRVSYETCRIFGLEPYPRTESIHYWLSFIYPGDLDMVMTRMSEIQHSNVDFSVTCRIILKDGSIKHICLEGSRELDVNGEGVGLYGIVQNITEKVLLERERQIERQMKQIETISAVMMAQEKERSHIGLELHDNLNQILSATKLYIELAKTDKKNRMTLLDKSSVFLVSVIESIKKISHSLDGPGVHTGLFNCINILVADLASVHPINIRFYANDIQEKDLSASLQLAIFRIVQEQVNNILIHSKATHATLTLCRRDHEVVLMVIDNGQGLDIHKQVIGPGIRNIQSRADIHNGTVIFLSSPGNGYEMNVSLSLDSYAGNYVIAGSKGLPVSAMAG